MDDPKSFLPPNLPVASPSSPSIAKDPGASSSVNPAPINRGPSPVSSVPPVSAFSPKPPLSSVPPPSSPAAPHALPPPPAGGLKREISPRSSIRTMEGDIKSAQTGQAPKGTEVKPPMFPTEAPKPPVLAAPKPPISPAAPPTGIKLGEAEKRISPLPSPVLPKQPPVPPVKPPVVPSGIAVPPKPSLFANRRIMIIGGVAVLILVGGFLYLRFGQEPEVAIPTPPPTVSPVPTLKAASPVTLAGFMGQPAELSISDFTTLRSGYLQAGAVNLSNNSSSNNLLVTVKNENGDNIKFSQFLNQFVISFPINLVSYVDNSDFNLILTKQTEFFDQSGNPVANPSAEMLLTPKIALAVRVIDITEALLQLTFWEDTLADNLREFYDLPLPTEVPLFFNNTYQGVAIRFANFPYPDQAIDYAIVTASNGNDYLIIAHSREQIYSIIDKLLGF